MMEISETIEAVETSAVKPGFLLECGARYIAPRSKNFPKLLEDVKKAVEDFPINEEIVSVSSKEREDPSGRSFTITVRVLTDSWYNAGDRLNETLAQVLSAAKIVEFGADDSALQRFMKSQNDRFVERTSRSINDITESS